MNKVTCEDKTETEILKQEQIVTNCEMQEEMEDNYNNVLRQKLAKKALFDCIVKMLARCIFIFWSATQ